MAGCHQSPGPVRHRLGGDGEKGSREAGRRPEGHTAKPDGFGVVCWNPAQLSNDLLAIKKKYGRSLVICGGWDILGELADPDVTEETVKSSVYKAIDTYAPGGGYVFCGSFLGPTDDQKTKQKNRWLQEDVATYGRDFYIKH